MSTLVKQNLALLILSKVLKNKENLGFGVLKIVNTGPKATRLVARKQNHLHRKKEGLQRAKVNQLHTGRLTVFAQFSHFYGGYGSFCPFVAVLSSRAFLSLLHIIIGQHTKNNRHVVLYI